MRVRMRQAQRQMKGTKLQYLDQMPVLFSDVAGVPGAKVCSPATAKPGSHCQAHHCLNVQVRSGCDPAIPLTVQWRERGPACRLTPQW